MMAMYTGRDKVPSYKSFKAKYFEKTKTKLHTILNGIKYSSLKYEDKVKLKENILKQIQDFDIKL